MAFFSTPLPATAAVSWRSMALSTVRARAASWAFRVTFTPVW